MQRPDTLHNPAMQFPSLGSIVGKEAGPANGMPPYVIVPRWERDRQYQDYFKSAFLGRTMRRCWSRIRQRITLRCRT